MFKQIKNATRPYRRAFERIIKGKTSLVELGYCRSLQFSQFGEDIIIRNFFNGVDDGFFVDVGAFHPYRISNTYLLYKMGWKGINIEPNPQNFSLFEKYRKRDINLNLAVSGTTRVVDFICNGEFSGIDDEQYFLKDTLSEADRISVKSRPLSDIFDEYLPKNQTIDVMDVDCEGLDEEVLLSNNWEKYRPKMLLVEAHTDVENLDLLLVSLGYQIHTTLDITRIYVQNNGG